jgi:hypothetical protein
VRENWNAPPAATASTSVIIVTAAATGSSHGGGDGLGPRDVLKCADIALKFRCK